MYKAAVLGSIPEKYRLAAVALLHSLAHDAVVFAVEALRSLERPLARLSLRLRQSAPRPSGKEPSPFLKTIAPEKRAEVPSANPADSI
jgi:hypothetical protein